MHQSRSIPGEVKSLRSERMYGADSIGRGLGLVSREYDVGTGLTQ